MEGVFWNYKQSTACILVNLVSTWPPFYYVLYARGIVCLRQSYRNVIQRNIFHKKSWKAGPLLVGCRLRCTDECLFRAPWVYWEDRSTITARKHTELLLPAQNSEFRIPEQFSLPGHIYRHDFTQPLIRLVCDLIRFADVQDNTTALRGFRLSACVRRAELRGAYELNTIHLG